jgi:hypothetical protein
LPPRKILEQCPSCGSPLTVTELHCSDCGTQIRGAYQPCTFCRLTPEQSNFLLMFVRTRGNLSEVEKQLGISYPTLRGKLDEVIRVLTPAEPEPASVEADSRRAILTRLAEGKLSASDALSQLGARRT